ncbi:MAG: polyprenyl diphosphate synthase [Candidatus ainarchaeum sp.]|nr:polyprenyl diphosphate synthase [Candidatus ainarchaeum sp.]
MAGGEDGEKIEHIAIIPDGNRRWAKEHNISKEEAYAIGIRKIGDVLKWCKEKDVKILTMWGFSLENFKREKGEMLKLFELFKKNLVKAIGSEEKERFDVNVRFLGRINLFPDEIKKMMEKAEEISRKNKKYQLNLLMSYGGRAEILDAVNRMLKDRIAEVDEKTFSDYLYTKGIPDPDLIIRTSGEKRLSGLLPWQSTYSELYFCDKLWPDFNKNDFLDAIEEFNRRKRRFGK